MNNNDFAPEPTSTGIRVSGNRIVGYSAAIRELDNGRYDRSLSKGLDMLACIMEAVESNWIALNIEKQIIVWRWLVVAIFLSEEQKKNGTVEIQNDEGGIDTAVIYSSERGAISIYPGPERFALANHVEAIAIEKYGREEGLPLALRIYQDMVKVHPKKGFVLSALGREGFSMLHDSFIEQIQTDGMPDMPVMH